MPISERVGAPDVRSLDFGASTEIVLSGSQFGPLLRRLQLRADPRRPRGWRRRRERGTGPAPGPAASPCGVAEKQGRPRSARYRHFKLLHLTFAHMEDWYLHHCRLSMIGAGVQLLRPEAAEAVFRDLFGSDHEVDEYRSNRTVRRRQGQADRLRVDLLEQPGRVDATWMSLAPLEAIGVEAADEIAIGKLEAIQNFHDQAIKLFEASSDVHRVACGGVLFLPAKSPSESYNQMQRLVPKLNLSYEQVGDFMLQLNRFRNFDAAPNLRLNRLFTLNSLRSALIQHPAPLTSSALTQIGGCWTQLAFDVNSDASNTRPLISGQFAAMLPELLNSVEFLAGTPL